MSSVKIGHEFFKNIKSDYSNWKLAIIREFAQNGIDARGTKTIKFTTGPGTLTVSNDGQPMDEDTLINKFLALGGTTKGVNDIGGFGVAKALLCFMHKSYTIRTGTLLVQGSGAEYTLQRDLPYYHGTETTIQLVEPTDFEPFIKYIAFYTQWNGAFYLNGEHYSTSHHKGKPRRDFGWCKVYTNRLTTNKMVIRINGIPMFVRHCDQDKNCVVVEITGPSKEILTANRDGLRYEYSSQLDAFLVALSVDKRSALSQHESEVTHYKGRKLSNYEKSTATASEDTTETIKDRSPSMADIPDFQDGNRTFGRSTTWLQVEDNVAFNTDFVIKNNTRLKIANHFIPGSMSTYSENLLHVWQEAVLGVMKSCNINGQVTIGFIFDEEREAEYYRTDTLGHVILINPVNINTEKGVMKNKWAMTAQGKWSLIAIAAHELVHFMGLSAHNEDYASKLTEIIGKLLANRKVFSPCFRKVRRAVHT